jgi:hypothetical protein
MSDKVFTFQLAVPEDVMHEVIEWTDRQDLGALPSRIAVFIAHVGNAANWHEARRTA